MTRDPTRPADDVSRRKFVLATAGVGAAAIAGCSGDGDGGTSTPTPGNDSEDTPMDTPDDTDQATESGTITPLECGGSSTVYPMANTAASYWQANRPASDTEYWPHEEYGIDTDKNLADYWAGLYGFEPGEDGAPPFRWTVGLSHSGTGVRKVRDGLYDMGNSSGNVEDELPERDSYDSFVDHVVGVDGQPLVVSSEIKEAGVSTITGDQLKGMYMGEITNWSELGGPDQEIRVLGRAKDSGTRTSFVNNVWGSNVNTPGVANRYGQNQRLAAAIADADNAFSYLALAFLDTDGVEPVALEWEGTTYEYEAEDNGLDATEYPLSRDLHMYTWEGTSNKEAAVINMMLSDFGQDTFVAPNNYFRISESRREEERAKLPDQV